MHTVYASTLTAILLASCAAAPGPQADGMPGPSARAEAQAGAEDKPVSVMGTGTERIANGLYTSPMWLSHEFDGTQSRRFEGDTLVLTMDQTHPKGGLDTAIATNEDELPDVADVSDDLVVCFAYDVDLTGEGSWWAGPKISVDWNREAEVETDGWFETYVVETADVAPDVLEARMYDYFDAQFIGETRQDGGVYRHFVFPFVDWMQFWAIRQDYRTEGGTSIGPILGMWQQHGLPADGTFDGVKVNIETHGDMRGTVRIDGEVPQSYRNPSPMTCDEA